MALLSLLKKAGSEPFFHFAIIGALLFWGGEKLEQQQQADRYSIKIGDAELKRFSGLWEKQYGGEPSSAELDELAENYIRQEVLYREALNLGLDKDDEIVKRRLVQKLEFLQQDLWTAQEPPLAELQNYYQHHAERYVKPERVSFHHLYFSADKPGDTRQRAEAALVALNQGKSVKADHFADGNEFAQYSAEDVRRVFGNTPLSSNITKQEPQHWLGPFASGYGWHLVYIDQKIPTEQQAFNEVIAAVKNDWQQTLRQQKNAEAFNQLKQRYTIVREPTATANIPQLLVSK
jgi:hypothetical protein